MEKILKNFLDIMYNLCNIILYTMWVIVGITYLCLIFNDITTFNFSLFIPLNIMLFIFICIWFVSYCDNKKDLNPLINTIYQKTKIMLYIIGGIGYFLSLLLIIQILIAEFLFTPDNNSIVDTGLAIVFPLTGLIITRAFFNKKIRYAFYVYVFIIIIFVLLT